MRPFLLLTLAITVTGISTTTHANTAAPQERWEGYRSATSPEVQNLNLPFQGFAENAVLDMETIGMTRTAGERFDVVDVNSIPQETDRHVLSNPQNVIPFQIETCRKQGLRYCPVLSYSNNGTAFFNRGRFVTCRHGFHNWISLASQLNGDRPVSQISPPMILRVQRNGRTTTVYNSGYDGKPQMQFRTINDDPRLNFQTFKTSFPSQQLGILAAQADFTELTLSEPIVRDYALTERTSGTNNLRNNEETFLIGYPGRTNAFADGIGNSPGYRPMISNGLAQPPLAQFSFLQTTNYATPGMSGGSVVTGTGELAGLHCNGDGSGTPGEDASSLRSYSYPLDRTLIQNYWRTLPYPNDQQLAEATDDIPQLTSVSQ